MEALAYLAGVLCGDGWCTHRSLGLRTKDRDFAQAFSLSLNTVFDISIAPKTDERGYWVVRTSNKTGRFNSMRQYEPSTLPELAMWLRGMFDSEGNAQLRPNGVSANSFGRRISFYSTNNETLQRTASYLGKLEILTSITLTKSTNGHKGTKPVFELRLLGAQDNYRRFSERVGSSIQRKQSVLAAIPESYRPNRQDHYRNAQRLGANTKNRQREESVLPSVIAAIRQMITQGIKPTQRKCASIPGYWRVQGYHTQQELVTRARGED